MACVSWKPGAPVQALAPPELSTTARTRPPLTTWRVHSTGAAWTRLEVNTAAAARDGPSFSDHGHVGLAGLLQAGRHSGGAESERGSDAHGATP